MPTATRNIFPLPDGRFAVRYRYGRKDCKRIFDSKDEAKQFIRAECELLRAYGQLWKQYKGNQLGRLFCVVDQLAPGDPTQGVRTLELLVKEHLARPASHEKTVSVAEAAESLIESWAKDSANERSTSYHRNAAAIIRSFVTVHGRRSVADVTSAMIRTWVSEQSAGNQKTAKARISRLFNHCIESDWRKDNPASGFKLRTQRKEVVQVPSATMIGRFLAMTMERDYRVLRPSIVLRFFAGLRTSEAARIEWKHIDLHRRTVSVVQGIAAKNGKARTVPIADNLTAWLTLDVKKSGRVAPINLAKLEADLRADFRAREGIVLGSPAAKLWDNALRHSYASYRYPLIQNLEILAAEMGNSRHVLLSHYVGAVSSEDEAAFWKLRPSES